MFFCFIEIVFEVCLIFDVGKMALMTKWIFFISITIFSSLVKESRACFTHNEVYEATAEKSGTSYYKECICKDATYEHTQNATHLYWLGPDGKIIEATGPGSGIKAYMERGENMISLTIPSLSKSLAGKYNCVFKNKDGSQYVISHEVEVYEPVYFIPANITPQFLVNGQDSLIRCTARGHEPPQIRWYKGEENDELASGDKYESSGEGLVIKNVSKEDEGQYLCSAEVPKTGEIKEIVINVEVFTPPNVEGLIASEEKLMKDDPLTIICEASGYPLPTYSWRKVPSENTSSTISTESNIMNENSSSKGNVPWKQEYNKIVFESVSMEDHGQYECIAQNSVGQSRKEIDIVVEAAPNITEFKNLMVEEGGAVSISCTAIGRPQPVINITYFETSSEYPFNCTENTDDPTSITFKLTIEKVQWYHQGDYNCSASNSVGSDERTMLLEVLHKPFFEKSYEVVWIYSDDPVNLSCDHKSKPPAKIQWSFQGSKDLVETSHKEGLKPIDEISHWKTFMQNDKLSLWAALVNNGTENNLTVNEPKEQVYHGMYECSASNYLGQAKKQFLLKVAFVPEKLTLDQINVTDVAATSVTFDIKNKSADDAPPLLGYTAEYDEEQNYNITDIHVNRSWAFNNVPFKIYKLKPMTTYRIRFAALNPAGTGSYGEYLEFITPEKSAPEPPSSEEINYEAIRIPADNRILKLKYPEHNGDPIDYYAIKYCQKDTEECEEQIVPPTAELDLHHLSHNTSYVLEILAHNSVGNSTSLYLQITLDADPNEGALLTPVAIIGIAVVVVIFCILVLDVILYFTMKKGMINTCVHKKNKKKKDESKQSRDKKGLLKDKEASDTPKGPDNGHKEYEYNKSTGIITGKHSAV